MTLTRKHALDLVQKSADTMLAHPEQHGYNDGITVPLAEIKASGRLCFCLMGGAAAYLAAERGATYRARHNDFETHSLFQYYRDLAEVIGMRETGTLITAHDETRDVHEMHAKVSKIIAEVRNGTT